MPTKNCFDGCTYNYEEVLEIREDLVRFLQSIESIDELDKIHVRFMQEMSCQFAVRRQNLLDDH